MQLGTRITTIALLTIFLTGCSEEKKDTGPTTRISMNDDQWECIYTNGDCGINFQVIYKSDYANMGRPDNVSGLLPRDRFTSAGEVFKTLSDDIAGASDSGGELAIFTGILKGGFNDLSRFRIRNMSVEKGTLVFDVEVTQMLSDFLAPTRADAYFAGFVPAKRKDITSVDIRFRFLKQYGDEPPTDSRKLCDNITGLNLSR